MRSAATVDSGLASLEAALGHRFGEPGWLERALTHSSSRQEALGEKGAEDNEKLEFLGDAILGALVSEHLVREFPNWSEGQLSKSRARLVSAISLHAAARRLRLGRYLRLGKGEEKTGGREKPAVLADAYEAVVAAIYLDGGLDAAREFVRSSLLDHALGDGAQRLAQPDHKSGLQELLQGRGGPTAEYRVASESGPEHRKTFVVEVRLAGRVVATGSGASKKEAELAAARLALEQLRRTEE
ncbi:MAG TPA: ribonuclease III [Candidatus Acidoferrales bacterium]|nr:ribonuclease III [Candidatus Acidoferrales bacterium]